MRGVQVAPAAPGVIPARVLEVNRGPVCAGRYVRHVPVCLVAAPRAALTGHDVLLLEGSHDGGAEVEVVSVRRERLRALTDDLDYGCAEVRLEGMTSDDPGISPSVFLDRYFVDAQGMSPDDEVTRIDAAGE